MTLTPEMFDLTLLLLSGIVTLVVLPILKKMGGLAAEWIEAKAHSASFACATLKLTELVFEAVKEAEITFVKKMKDSPDKQWDAQAMALARDSAKDAVFTALGPAGRREVLGCLKTDEEGLLQRVYQMIEVENE